MRVLFVVKEYLPKPTPPGICVMNVQKALLDRGVHSDVLMAGDEEGLYVTNEIGDVYSIKAKISFEKKKEGIFSYLKVHLPMLFTWPVPSKRRVDDYRKVIAKLDGEKHYDAVIGTMFPADVCVACSAFDHFFLYELDSLVNNPMYKDGIKRYLSHRLLILERKLFNRAELIIHLNHNKKFYGKDEYKAYLDKSVYTDIPNLVEKDNPNRSKIEQDTVIDEIADDQLLVVYSGHLSKAYRPPFELIELIKLISKEFDIKCLFFSRGDCEDAIREAETKTNGIIKRMGYVSREILDRYVQRADFLLDIGNRLSGEDYSLPSKVIDYMATGKPIIHINGINDSAIDYLEKYDLAVNLQVEKPMAEIVQEVTEFIKFAKGKKVPFEKVAEIFPKNTPEYTADLIIQHIKKRNLDA